MDNHQIQHGEEMKLPEEKQTDQTENLSSLFLVWAGGLKPSDYRFVSTEKLLSFRLWASRLSASRAERVVDEIMSLCRIPGLDRAWFRETLAQACAGSHSARMVLFFGLAVHERWLSKYHLRVWDWRKAPNSRRNREFGLRLYISLVESGFVRQPGEILFASPACRDAIIEAAILDAYRKDYPLLAALTREILFLQEHQRSYTALQAGE